MQTYFSSGQVCAYSVSEEMCKVSRKSSRICSKADTFNLPIEIQAAIYKIICIKHSQELSRQSELLRGIKSYIVMVVRTVYMAKHLKQG